MTIVTPGGPYLTLLDRTAVTPGVAYLPYQLKTGFAELYARNQPEILFVDSLVACKLPYEGATRTRQLGSGSYGSVHSSILRRFDPVDGWQIDAAALDGHKLALKLASTIESGEATNAEYLEAERNLFLDSQGMLHARMGKDTKYTTRTHASMFYSMPEDADDEESDSLLKLYFHHAIHPLSSVYKDNGIDGVARPHTVVGIELLEGGTLLDRLNEGRYVFSEREACALMRDVFLGLKQCHDNGFARRDVKVDNIGFGRSDKVTLFDFGMVEEIVPNGSRCCRGTPDFFAPELARFSDYRENKWDKSTLPSMDPRKLDVYAAGECLRWILDSRWFEEDQAFGRALDGELESEGFVMPEALAILEGIQEPDPEFRWSVDEALAQLQVWSDAIAHRCNGPTPRRPEISILRSPHGLASIARPTLPPSNLIDIEPEATSLPARCFTDITWPNPAKLEMRNLQKHRLRLEIFAEDSAQIQDLIVREREYASIIAKHDNKSTRLHSLQGLMEVMAPKWKSGAESVACGWTRTQTQLRPHVSDSGKRHLVHALAIPRAATVA